MQQHAKRGEVAIGRLELVSWLNHVVQADYTSVTDCADGVAFCQLLDAVYPGRVPLHRLNFDARFVEDRERNLRVVRDTLTRLEMEVDVDVEGIAKGKFQACNEFLRWTFALVNRNCPAVANTYNAFERRLEAQQKRRNAQLQKGVGGGGSAAPGDAGARPRPSSSGRTGARVVTHRDSWVGVGSKHVNIGGGAGGWRPEIMRGRGGAGVGTGIVRGSAPSLTSLGFNHNLVPTEYTSLRSAVQGSLEETAQILSRSAEFDKEAPSFVSPSKQRPATRSKGAKGRSEAGAVGEGAVEFHPSMSIREGGFRQSSGAMTERPSTAPASRVQRPRRGLDRWAEKARAKRAVEAARRKEGEEENFGENLRETSREGQNVFGQKPLRRPSTSGALTERRQRGLDRWAERVRSGDAVSKSMSTVPGDGFAGVARPGAPSRPGSSETGTHITARDPDSASDDDDQGVELIRIPSTGSRPDTAALRLSLDTDAPLENAAFNAPGLLETAGTTGVVERAKEREVEEAAARGVGGQGGEGGGGGGGGGGTSGGGHGEDAGSAGNGGENLSDAASRLMTPLAIDTPGRLPSAMDQAAAVKNDPQPSSLPPTPEEHRRRERHTQPERDRRLGAPAAASASAVVAREQERALERERRREMNQSRLRREQLHRHRRAEEEVHENETSDAEEETRRERETAQERKDASKYGTGRTRDVAAVSIASL